MQLTAPYHPSLGTRHAGVSSRAGAAHADPRRARGACRFPAAALPRRGGAWEWLIGPVVILLGVSATMSSSASERDARPGDRPAEIHGAAAPETVIFTENSSPTGAETSRDLDLDRLRKRAAETQAKADASGDPQDARAAALAWIRVSETLQAQGEYRGALAPLDRARASSVESSADGASERQPDALADAMIEAAMGNLLLVLAPADEAERVLTAALAKAREVDAPALIAAVLVNLGNARVMRAGESAPSETQRLLRAAFEAYQEADRTLASGPDRLAQARARASAARVAVDLEDEDPEASWRAAEALVAQVDAASDRAALWLHGATTLALAESRGQADGADGAAASESDPGEARPAARLRIHGLLVRALELAESERDDRLRGYALLQLATLYREEQRDEDARALVERALRSAGRTDDPVLAWRAWLARARLERAAGRRAAALAAYSEALEEIEEIRHRRAAHYGSDPTIGHAEAQRAYLEAVDLLLARAAERAGDRDDLAAPDEQASPATRAAIEADLALAQRTLERLKADELRDYFDDECVDAALREEVEAGQVDPDSVLVYPIPLPDRLELLVSSRHGRQRVSIPVSAEEIASTAQRFRQELQNRMTRRHLRPARKLYDWLIRPLEPSLRRWGTRTLVFVPGGPLRTVPMAALHDGERYLIERFAVAMTPGLDLTHPRPVDRGKPLALLGGLSESVAGFEALPEVADELDTLSRIVEGTILIDERFNPESVEKELGRKPFSVVHIASHAGFESADEAYVLTHSGKISVGRFAETLSLFRDRDQPLELLMLSACETAEGDERAALGLSGIGVKAGARSAVGSLWLVSDEAARSLSTRFYRALFEDGASRAEALRQAQRALLAQDAYRHPFYWAPFILIGNWL